MNHHSESVLTPTPSIPTISSQHILNELSDVIVVLDKTGRIVYTNSSSFDMWGFTSQELLNTNIIDLVEPHEKRRTLHYFTQIHSGYSGLYLENRCRRKDGKVISISWVARWNESDQLLYATVSIIKKRLVFDDIEFQYEAALKQRDQEVAELLERMPDGYFVLDTDWRIVYGNPKAEQLVGKTLEDVYLKSIWDCFPADYETVFETQYRKAIKEQSPVLFEAFFANPLYKWLEVNAYPSSTGLSVFFRDITERKNAEAELRKLSLIATETTNAVSLVELDGTISWVNKAFVNLTGYSAAEVIGIKSEKIWIGPETDTQLVQQLRASFNAGKPFQAELLGYTKTGEKIWTEVSGQIIANEYGGVQRYCIIYTDITDRKKAENELRKLSVIAQETINAVAISDTKRRIVWINKACEQMSGYKLQEAVGKTVTEIFDGPLTDGKKISYAESCFQSVKPFHIEVLNYRKNGETYWADVSSQPMFDENGKLLYYFSISTDITNRKKLEEELQLQRNRTTAAVIAAQEKERALVGQELHDNVNQVLTTVKLYTELCRDGIGNASEIMDKSIKLLQDSIDEVRSLSRRLSAPSLGDIKLKESVTELVEAVRATNKLQISLTMKGVEELEVNQDVHLALYRILQEHLTNVLKHSEASHVKVYIEAKQSALSLQVNDDGLGFDLQQKSNGIGISNMMSRAESIKGSLVIRSAPGMGCELQVCFPVEW